MQLVLSLFANGQCPQQIRPTIKHPADWWYGVFTLKSWGFGRARIRRSQLAWGSAPARPIRGVANLPADGCVLVLPGSALPETPTASFRLNRNDAVQPRMDTDRHGCRPGERPLGRTLVGALVGGRIFISESCFQSVFIRVHPWLKPFSTAWIRLREIPHRTVMAILPSLAP